MLLLGAWVAPRQLATTLQCWSLNWRQRGTTMQVGRRRNGGVSASVVRLTTEHVACFCVMCLLLCDVLRL